MKKQFLQFLVRWGLNIAGLFVSAQLISGVSYQSRLEVLIIAGLTLSFANALVKPFVVILALPALLFTLGIFSVIINGLMVYLAHLIYSPFEVESFTAAVLAGLVIGLLNYTVTRIFDIFVQE
jgi:putative membrane protein